MRPDRPFAAACAEAVRRGWHAAIVNLPSILALQAAIAAVVATYYLWPAGSAVLSSYGRWQFAHGGLGNGVSLALAGGALSELSFVLFQQKGRWRWANLENLAFKLVIFFISGVIVYYFYCEQAVWWGTGTTLAVIVPKVIVDQFGYTIIFSTPYYALLTRWHALRYSGTRLARELRDWPHYFTERFLPILVTNWMFWIPTVSFVYAMPMALQPSVAAFATAIWGLLVSTLGSEEGPAPAARDTVASAVPPMVVDSVE